MKINIEQLKNIMQAGYYSSYSNGITFILTIFIIHVLVALTTSAAAIIMTPILTYILIGSVTSFGIGLFLADPNKAKQLGPIVSEEEWNESHSSIEEEILKMENSQ